MHEGPAEPGLCHAAVVAQEATPAALRGRGRKRRGYTQQVTSRPRGELYSDQLLTSWSMPGRERATLMVKVEESWWGRRLACPSGWYFTTKFMMALPCGAQGSHMTASGTTCCPTHLGVVSREHLLLHRHHIPPDHLQPVLLKANLQPSKMRQRLTDQLMPTDRGSPGSCGYLWWGHSHSLQ